MATKQRDYGALGIEELRAVIQEAQTALDGKIEVRKQELIAELESLGGSMVGGKGNKLRGGMTLSGKRAAPGPKYRSKKNPNFTWTGRDADPKWLREEMEESGQAKHTFLIEK